MRKANPTTILTQLAVIAVLLGGSMAASAATVTEGFDTFSTSYEGTVKVLTLPEGWDYSGDATLFSRDDDTFHSKRPAIMVEGANADCYLITPELQGDFTFFMRNRTKNYQASMTAYACTFADGELTLGSEIGSTTLAKTTSGQPAWQSIALTAPTVTRVALLLSDAIVDDFTYTEFEATEEATLVVTGFASGSAFDFGTVAAGTTHVFTLQNIGQEELAISSIAVTGGFTITEGGSMTAIAPKGVATITIATPAADAEGLLTIDSNDAASPYSISLKSTYKVPAPVMAVSTMSVAFGKVTATASQDITVSNTGDATLQVAIASDKPEEFAVSTSSLSIAPGEEQTFTVSFIFLPTAYGGHTATITLTPNAGEPVSIEASAQVADPNAWAEDFASNMLPDGWDIIGSANSWTFADGQAKGKYEGSSSWLITPSLIVKEGEALTFQAMSYQYGSDIKVQCQKDGQDWTTKIYEARNTQQDFETYTISGLAPGTYRFRIATENIIIDNFEGFTLMSDETTVKETWYVSYAFTYIDSNDVQQTESDVEQMTVEFSGDNVAFHFPNPINGNAWLRGTKASDDTYTFSNGQYIAKYGIEDAYFCGSDGANLTDITFIYNETAKTFTCLGSILVNSSQTAISYWGYFTDVVVSKEAPVHSGITEVSSRKEEGRSGVYDLQGRPAGNSRNGLIISNGRLRLR